MDDYQSHGNTESQIFGCRCWFGLYLCFDERMVAEWERDGKGSSPSAYSVQVLLKHPNHAVQDLIRLVLKTMEHSSSCFDRRHFADRFLFCHRSMCVLTDHPTALVSFDILFFQITRRKDRWTRSLPTIIFLSILLARPSARWLHSIVGSVRPCTQSWVSWAQQTGNGFEKCLAGNRQLCVRIWFFDIFHLIFSFDVATGSIVLCWMTRE